MGDRSNLFFPGRSEPNYLNNELIFGPVFQPCHSVPGGAAAQLSSGRVLHHRFVIGQPVLEEEADDEEIVDPLLVLPVRPVGRAGV